MGAFAPSAFTVAGMSAIEMVRRSIGAGKIMKKPWGTCREVTALVSAREDRDLSLGERAVLRFHAFICGRCQRWEEQVKFMRQSMQAWKNYRD